MASGFEALAELVRGATFDDFLLRPQYSVIARRDPAVIDLSCRFSTHITLQRPLVSANMDTVTSAPMAIVQAASATATSNRRSARCRRSSGCSTSSSAIPTRWRPTRRSATR
jgi:hypothetical protein